MSVRSPALAARAGGRDRDLAGFLSGSNCSSRTGVPGRMPSVFELGLKP
jgi:hypothetical protein